MNKKRVAVIGAGLGGLSNAIRLAHSGLEVDVYEQQPNAGGQANTKTFQGYRFDTGPSLLTMPHVFRQLFEEVEENIDNYLRFVPLSIICKYFYEGGIILNAYRNIAQFGEEIKARTSDNPQNLQRYLDYSRTIYDLTSDLFLWSSLHEFSSFLKWKSIQVLFQIWKLDAFRTMHQANASFFKDKKLIQIFDRYATYNGSSPYRAPATLNIIPHVEYNIGGYAVEGGIYAIPQALEKLAWKKGVRFHYQSRVDKICTRNRKVAGIIVNGEQLPYDIIVSNVDVTSTYCSLLQDETAPMARRYARLEPSSSGLVFYWGMKEKYPELGVNNIFFSDDYSADFYDIFVREICPRDPTIYINVSSKVTPSDAPQDGENWFILINAPHNEGQDWKKEVDQTRERLIAKLERMLKREIRKNILCEDTLTPLDIEKNTNIYKGSLYGISSNTRTAAFLRHPNRSTRYPGLYFCGGSAHPGGGMPLVVLSGKITADLIKKYELK